MNRTRMMKADISCWETTPSKGASILIFLLEKWTFYVHLAHTHVLYIRYIVCWWTTTETWSNCRLRHVISLCRSRIRMGNRYKIWDALIYYQVARLNIHFPIKSSLFYFSVISLFTRAHSCPCELTCVSFTRTFTVKKLYVRYFFLF